MNIAIVGLGLIGGSFCKAISKRTEHTCFGIDINENIVQSAISDKVIKNTISPTQLKNMDLTILCLHPQATIDFILENKDNFKKGSIVIDSCGVKESIINQVFDVLFDKGVEFIGCHPMAGREFSGYKYSLENLFDNASFIIALTDNNTKNNIRIVKNLAEDIGFIKVVVATPNEHDKIIAFTSQLAHIVSNAYIKSPTLNQQSGFSAGSFLDLTRVAKLNENMWTDLFMKNKEPLLFEIDTLINNLMEYKKCLENNESVKLKALLKKGRILKEQLNNKIGS